MSGGAFDYVSVNDLESPTDEHDFIVDEVEKHNKAVAEILRGTLRRLRAAQQEAAAEWSKYRGVLRAVEWQRSGDGDVAAIKHELAKVVES